MKKILLSLFVLGVVGTTVKVQSQCTVSDLGVNLKEFNSATCVVKFDFTWVQEVNNGNKFAYVHLWTEANYHTPAANWVGMYSNPPSSPDAADLATSLGTIAIFNNGTATPFIGTSYPPDGGVIPLTSGLTITKTPIPGGTTEQMTIEGITLTLPACTGVVKIKADVWASQAENGKNVHCASQGLLFNLNNPRVTGVKVCNPRSISFGITNNDPAIPITINWNLYKDDGDGIFEPGTGAGRDGAAINTETGITIAPSATYSKFQFAFNGSTTAGEKGNYWLQVETTSPAFSFGTFAEILDPGCAALPVDFKSFTAARNRSNVNLKWETMTERNCEGFAIDRNVGGAWEQIAFVPSKGQNGNSDDLLAYTYVDLNQYKGISQYRIRQVDLDSRSKYSEIRSVRGEGQSGKTIVYPNPSNDGRVNIVFEETNVSRNVSVMDMSGRLIKQWRSVTNNNLTIDNLTPGMYSLRILAIETGEQTVEKIVVNKR